MTNETFEERRAKLEAVYEAMKMLCQQADKEYKMGTISRERFMEIMLKTMHMQDELLDFYNKRLRELGVQAEEKKYIH